MHTTARVVYELVQSYGLDGQTLSSQRNVHTLTLVLASTYMMYYYSKHIMHCR